MTDVLPADQRAAIRLVVESYAAQGKRIDHERAAALMIRYKHATSDLTNRLYRDLDEASRACEAVIGRGKWCQRLGTQERDGRRVCGKHANAGR
jgi:hypothetical protein